MFNICFMVYLNGALKVYFPERLACIEGCQQGNRIQVRDADAYREIYEAVIDGRGNKLPQHIREPNII